jgi:hypothetical protein
MKPNDKSDECELPDVCPCKGDCDHYHSRHQAQFCPGLGRAAAFIVVHSHGRWPPFRMPAPQLALEGAHDRQEALI